MPIHRAILSMACGAIPLLACIEGRGAAGAGALPDEVVTLMPDMRIDGTREDLAPVRWIQVRSDGSIAVARALDRAIRFYDPDGHLRATFGRQGGGPGEFRALSVAGLRDDTLWVFDFQLRRITLIAGAERAGEFTDPPTSASTAVTLSPYERTEGRPALRVIRAPPR